MSNNAPKLSLPLPDTLAQSLPKLNSPALQSPQAQYAIEVQTDNSSQSISISTSNRKSELQARYSPNRLPTLITIGILAPCWLVNLAILLSEYDSVNKPLLSKPYFNVVAVEICFTSVLVWLFVGRRNGYEYSSTFWGMWIGITSLALAAIMIWGLLFFMSDSAVRPKDNPLLVLILIYDVIGFFTFCGLLAIFMLCQCCICCVRSLDGR